MKKNNNKEAKRKRRETGRKKRGRGRRKKEKIGDREIQDCWAGIPYL